MLTVSKLAIPASSRSVLVFEDPASRALMERVERIAPSNAPVMITGETGTGKELVARELHARSRRARQPFVAVNAGALSESLIESELFGHEKGAFTGAHADRAGWFEAAHGGTLFLDEIGELPIALQVKLLRVLQEGEVTRLGSRLSRPVDVRLVAATNLDLRAAIRAKRFREDLFYRLNVAALELAPLRERPGDILPLARHFISLYANRLGQRAVRLGPGAARRLVSHAWPGNIRELENAIHHGLLVREGLELEADDLQLSASEPSEGARLAAQPARDAPSALGKLERALEELLEQGVPNLHERVEAALLSTTYHYCGENQLETARLLGLSRNVVRARLIQHGELSGPLRRSVPSRTCGPAFDIEPRRLPQASPIRIGYQKLGLLMLVKGYGTFDAALAARGCTIDWVEYEGGIQIVDALRAGTLAAGIVGSCPAVFAQAADVPIVYVAAEPPAPQGAALIVPEHSTVKRVGDLRGKRVAVNRAAQAHYLLVTALEEAGVDRQEVEICFAPPEQALRAFRAREIDAWAIWDPWLSSARLDFGARVLRDASGLMKNSAYYLARRDVAERSPELVAELLAHLQLAAQWAQRDPAAAAARVAPSLGISARALIASLERELHTMPVSAELIAAQQHIADTLLRMDLIPHAVSVADAQWLAS